MERQPLTIHFSLSGGCSFHPSFIYTVSRAKLQAQNKDQSVETRLEVKQLIVNLVNLKISETGEQLDPQSEECSRFEFCAIRSMGRELLFSIKVSVQELAVFRNISENYEVSLTERGPKP